MFRVHGFKRLGDGLGALELGQELSLRKLLRFHDGTP